MAVFALLPSARPRRDHHLPVTVSLVARASLSEVFYASSVPFNSPATVL